MMESINVVFDDASGEKEPDVEPDVETSVIQNDIPEGEKESESNYETDEPKNVPRNKGPSVRVQKNHPKELIIGNPEQGIT
ncbi:gag-pol polyprotein, partial [Trifolium medium]|nr:gag-pol polyprotein [Trifolium medium]